MCDVHQVTTRDSRAQVHEQIQVAASKCAPRRVLVDLAPIIISDPSTATYCDTLKQTATPSKPTPSTCAMTPATSRATILSDFCTPTLSSTATSRPMITSDPSTPTPSSSTSTAPARAQEVPTALAQSKLKTKVQAETAVFSCQVCDLVFATAQALGGHKKNSFSHMQALKNPAQKALASSLQLVGVQHREDGAGRVEYTCEVCGDGEVFRSVHAFGGHKRSASHKKKISQSAAKMQSPNTKVAYLREVCACLHFVVPRLPQLRLLFVCVCVLKRERDWETEKKQSRCISTLCAITPTQLQRTCLEHERLRVHALSSPRSLCSPHGCV